MIVVRSKFQILRRGTDNIAYSILHYKNSIRYITPKVLLYSPIVIGRLNKCRSGNNAVNCRRFSTIVLPTGQETIAARNAIDAHAQDFVVSDELLLPFLKAFPQCPRSLHATRNVRCFRFVRSNKYVCLSYQ